MEGRETCANARIIRIENITVHIIITIIHIKKIFTRFSWLWIMNVPKQLCVLRLTDNFDNYSVTTDHRDNDTGKKYNDSIPYPCCVFFSTDHCDNNHSDFLVQKDFVDKKIISKISSNNMDVSTATNFSFTTVTLTTKIVKVIIEDTEDLRNSWIPKMNMETSINNLLCYRNVIIYSTTGTKTTCDYKIFNCGC